MMIKSIDITAFGGLTNCHMEFNKGINLIYGENEAGKSTIQNFIKVWLYGFSNYRGKSLLYNERLKYTPLNGEKIEGILNFIIDEREYMIIRSFGKTKKDDEIKVLDSLSGEDLTAIYGEEPGEKLLGVNRATFIKTLFIGQLSVEIKKDNDEKIIDKIVNFTGGNEEEANIQKSFIKISEYIKSITNIRKNGTLDLARAKRGSLELEKMEYYKAHENTMIEEEKLLQLKNKKSRLAENTHNLSLYKKYLQLEKLKDKYNIIQANEREFRSYREQINQLQKEISILEYKKGQYIENIDSSSIIENINADINTTFINYETKLNELKNIYEGTQSLNYRKKYFVIFILLINFLLILNFKYAIIIFFIDISMTLYYLYDSFFNTKSYRYKFRKLSQEIKSIEDTLDELKDHLAVENYQELFKRINLYYQAKSDKVALEKKIAQKNDEIKLLQMKMQIIGPVEKQNEKTYLEKKIKELNLSDTNLDDENVLINLLKTMNMPINFKNLTLSEKQEKIELQITATNKELLQCEKEIITIENTIKNSFYGKRPLAEIEEDILNLDAKMDELKKKLKAGELAREMMKKAYLEIRDDFGPQLNKKLLSKYKAICHKEYNHILVSDEYEINLIKDNSILDYKLLSNGSKDQLFLALRLSFIEMIFDKKDIPLFLDDAFVQYDDKKLKNTLRFLLEESYEQQLLFTCHNRENHIFHELAVQFNYLELP